MKYCLIIIGVFLYLQYEKRIDKSQNFSNWLSSFWALINPMNGKDGTNYLNLAIFAKQKGII